MSGAPAPLCFCYHIHMPTGGQALWTVTLGILLGMLARAHIPMGVSILMWLATLAAACAVVSLLTPRMSRAPIILGLLLVASFILGSVRMESARLAGDPFLDAHIGESVLLAGTVVREPDKRERSVRITVHVDTAASTSAPIHATILATMPPFTQVAYGDEVTLRGVITIPEAFDTGDERAFDYPGYLATSRVGYIAERATLVAVRESEMWSLMKTILAIKRWYLDGIASALPEPHASLGAGITAGEKRGLGPAISEEFRIASLTHIIVLSGYNITIATALLAALMRHGGSGPRLALGASVALFFILLTGGAAASVRAGVMALIASAAQTSGRIYLASRALAAAIIGMALWNPLLVPFDPGFQLSILATAGLIWLSPIAAAYLSIITERFALREIVASTVGAQAAVLPLLLFQNGMLSLVALPANIAALVAVPGAMLATAGAGIVGALAPALAPLAGFPAFLILEYILDVAHVAAAAPLSHAAIPAFSPALLWVAYAGLAGLALAWHVRRTATKAVAVGSDRTRKNG